LAPIIDMHVPCLSSIDMHVPCLLSIDMHVPCLLSRITTLLFQTAV
jgi:hypothetical protein